MKSVVIIGPAHPLRGGIAAYTQRLAQQFVQEQCEVILYTFSLQYPSFLFPGKTQYSSDPAPQNLQIKVCINSINPFNWIKVGNEIKKRNADAVVFNYWLPFIALCYGTIARIIARNKKTKIISVIHNMIPHEKRTGDKMLSKYFINSCNGFVTMATQVDKDLQQFTSTTNKVITPHPLYDHYGEIISKEEACRQLNLDPSFRYVLFFGLIRKYKGLDLLLEAFADERLNTKNLKLIVAGEFYEDRSYYNDIIAKHHIYNKVLVFPDFIPDEMVKNYFCAADLVILPYKNATQSGVTGIALHFEKPLIVSKFGGLPESVIEEQTGYIVDAKPLEIASAIEKFYSITDYSEMKESIKTKKKAYSWSNVVNAINRLAN